MEPFCFGKGFESLVAGLQPLRRPRADRRESRLLSGAVGFVLVQGEQD